MPKTTQIRDVDDDVHLADRVWGLRESVRSDDAHDVALGEALDAALVTCDRRLARAAGPTCKIVVPPE